MPACLGLGGVPGRFIDPAADDCRIDLAGDGDAFDHLRRARNWSSCCRFCRTGSGIAVSVKMSGAPLYSRRLLTRGSTPSQSSAPRRNGCSSMNPIIRTSPEGCRKIRSALVAT